MRDRKKTILTFLVLFGILLSWTGLAAGESSVEIHPENPKPQSTVTFNATIVDDTVSAVHVIVKECTPRLCFLPKNVTMTSSDTNRYQAEVMLTHDDATYITYHLDIESDGTWYTYPDEDFLINLSGEPDGNHPNGGDATNETPGFELGPIFVTILFAILVLRRKR